MNGAPSVNVRLVSSSDTRKNSSGQNTTVTVQNIVRASNNVMIRGPFDSAALARAWITARNAVVTSQTVATLDLRGVAKELYVEVA